MPIGQGFLVARFFVVSGKVNEEVFQLVTLVIVLVSTHICVGLGCV